MGLWKIQRHSITQAGQQTVKGGAEINSLTQQNHSISFATSVFDLEKEKKKTFLSKLPKNFPDFSDI